MGLLDKFLEASGGYVAGKHLTLADYAFVAVALSFEVSLRLTLFVPRTPFYNPTQRFFLKTLFTIILLF